MSNVVRLAIVDPIDSSRNQLKNLVLGIDTVWLEAECSRYDFFPDVVGQTQPDIALIAIDADHEKALNLIARLSQDVPGCQILVVSKSQEGSLILRAMRNGASEFLSHPLNLEDFLAALGRIRANKGNNFDESKSRASQVITIGGASGGVGCTSLAINLGCILAREERNSVVIIDLDFALGDSDIWLDIIPDYTIQDVAENITRLDYALLKRSLTKHESGIFLLPRPIHMEETLLMGPEQLKRVIALLKATFTHLVIDISKSYNKLDLAAMASSDEVLIVTQLDLPCLRNVVRLLQFFEHQPEIKDKVKVMLNRVGLDDSQISLSKALETIGRDVFWQIPNDYATMVESRNNGVPLIQAAPRAKLTRSLDQLAAALGNAPKIEVTQQPVEKPKKSLFSFLGK
ncbi:AAA family ATPase [Lacunimicrobium album]